MSHPYALKRGVGGYKNLWKIENYVTRFSIEVYKSEARNTYKKYLSIIKTDKLSMIRNIYQ